MLRCLKQWFPEEKIILGGNKAELCQRMLEIALKVMPARGGGGSNRFAGGEMAAAPVGRPRQISNASTLPPSFGGSVGVGHNYVPPRATGPPVLAKPTFDGTGVDRARYLELQNPYSEVVDVLGVIPIRSGAGEVGKLMEQRFVVGGWTDELREAVRQKRLTVQLRVFTTQGLDTRLDSKSRLTVNHERVEVEVRVPKYRKNLTEPHWTPVPLCLDRHFLNVHSGSVMFSFFNEQLIHGVIVIQTARDVPRAAMIARVLQRVSTPQAAAGQIGVGAASDELIETKYSVSLEDPIVRSRISTPVSGEHCNHFQCFDLETYLNSGTHNMCWNCPVCQRPTPVASLRVSRKFQELLEQFPDHSVVQCLADGVFVPFEPDKPTQKYVRSLAEKRKIDQAGRQTIDIESPDKRPALDPEPAFMILDEQEEQQQQQELEQAVQVQDQQQQQEQEQEQEQEHYDWSRKRVLEAVSGDVSESNKKGSADDPIVL